jgi:hypothetical protein
LSLRLLRTEFIGSRDYHCIRQGTFGVAEYRAFTVGADGHFVGFEPIVCDTDDQAIERAKRLVKGHGIEVWSGGRLIAKLEPE